MNLTRREWLRNAGLASGAALLGAGWRPGSRQFEPEALPKLAKSGRIGIEHIVVVTMENRSFDHLLGWLPNAEGKQGGLTFVDNSGIPHSSYPLSGDFTGCPHPSPDHSYSGDRMAYAKGLMDGFLRAGSNDIYSVGYYGEADIPFYGGLARHYTTCTRYFASVLGPTFPNRLFLRAAQTDRLDDSVMVTSLPTIWDRAGAGVSAHYYYSNVPFLALWGVKYLPISRLYEEFLAAASDGICPPSLSWTRDIRSSTTVLVMMTIHTRTFGKATASCIRHSKRWRKGRSGRTQCSSSTLMSAAASSSTSLRREQLQPIR